MGGRAVPQAKDSGDLIHDWNLEGRRAETPRPEKILLDDETLRDGLQSPSIQDPPIDKKLAILHLMDDLGIHTADVGLPGAGPHVQESVRALCREIAGAKMAIRANCAARTLVTDCEPVARISQDAGIPIETCVFLGSSPIRQFVEGWDLDRMLRHIRDSITFCRMENLPVMFVTEDTTRAKPETLRALYEEAIEQGAQRLCVADTVGHATPEGAFAVTKFVVDLARRSGKEVEVDWHGHRDRGLDLPNALAALRAGATRIHGCANGIGERTGNLPMDLLLVNLKLLGWIDNDLTKLPAYCRSVADAVGIPIPSNYPVVGTDAFETGTGVHAAAVIKAFRKGDDWLANRVYSGVPADEVGREQEILVGPVSGRSNVIFWLEKHGIQPTDARVDRVFETAKKSHRILTDGEIREAAGMA